jgi:DNA-binding MarR family transcriptional regulator
VTAFLDLHGSTNKLIRAVAEAAMRRHGLRLGQNLVLAALWERDGQTPGALAASLHVTTPTVVKMATRMTSSGLVTRRPDKTDSRLVRLWLTRAGRRLQQPVEAERSRIEKALTAGLTATERKVLLSALSRIHATAAALLRAGQDELP